MKRRLSYRRVTGLQAATHTAIKAAVTYEQVFVSTVQNATGAAQNIIHGLGGTPSRVVVSVQAGHNGAGAAGTQAAAVTYGSHTTTDCVVTVTAGATFIVTAYR